MKIFQLLYKLLYSNQNYSITYKFICKISEVITLDKALKKMFTTALNAAVVLPLCGLRANATNFNMNFLSSQNLKNENFNFIKSSQYAHDFIYDGSLLLYGGILLICISVIGLILTFSGKKKRKKKTQRNSSKKQN